MADVEKIHGAAEIERAPEPIAVDERAEKRVVRKLDWNLMPLILGLCKLPLSLHYSTSISSL